MLSRCQGPSPCSLPAAHSWLYRRRSRLRRCWSSAQGWECCHSGLGRWSRHPGGWCQPPRHHWLQEECQRAAVLRAGCQTSGSAAALWRGWPAAAAAPASAGCQTRRARRPHLHPAAPTWLALHQVLARRLHPWLPAAAASSLLPAQAGAAAGTQSSKVESQGWTTEGHGWKMEGRKMEGRCCQGLRCSPPPASVPRLHGPSHQGVCPCLLHPPAHPAGPPLAANPTAAAGCRPAAAARAVAAARLLTQQQQQLAQPPSLAGHAEPRWQGSHQRWHAWFPSASPFPACS